jgi:putative transposase
MRPKRPRLDPALYIGLQRYFLTFCTAGRRRCFVDGAIVTLVRDQILRSAERFDFVVVAYCFMPDHLHLLIEGTTDGADAIAFVHQAKQRSGYAYRGTGPGRLWQPSFYDHILRNEDATLAVARYILENPVRAGLVASPAEYPCSGSLRHRIREIMEAACWQPEGTRR